MKFLITVAAVVAALLTVLSTRLLVPALILLFRSIEAGFAPDAPSPVVAAEPVPVLIDETPKPAPKKRATRKRTTSRRSQLMQLRVYLMQILPPELLPYSSANYYADLEYREQHDLEVRAERRQRLDSV